MPKLEKCETCKGSKTHFDGHEWKCKRCDEKLYNEEVQFILSGNDWPGKSLRRQAHLKKQVNKNKRKW